MRAGSVAPPTVPRTATGRVPIQLCRAFRAGPVLGTATNVHEFVLQQTCTTVTFAGTVRVSDEDPVEEASHG